MVTLKRLLSLARGNKAKYFMAVACAWASVVCTLILPQIIRLTIDAIGAAQIKAEKLYIAAAAVMAVTFFNCVFNFFKGKLLAEASENIALRIKDSLYTRLQRVPYDYHVKAQTGDLIQRCTSDVETVRRFLYVHFAEMMRIIFLEIISIYILFSLHVRLTLISMISLPFIFLSSYIFFLSVKKTFADADIKEGELSSVLQENLSGVRVVRAFGRQKFETEKFEEKNLAFRTAVKKLINNLALFWGISDLICISQTLAALVFGILYVLDGEITLGTLIMFNSYVGMLIWPIRGLGRMLSDMGKMQVSLGRVFEILSVPEESDTENAADMTLNGSIRFDNVMFEYEEGKPVLNGLSFTAEAGETIAVLGSTGSGKSTLMHILLRLYDYQSGSVTIGGTELKKIKKSCLREKIGIVLQEPFLFSKTIRDNLYMARADATHSDLVQAASIASVHDVIESFEKGYDTIVGEKGITLSGGQKQRVAIARTLIRDSDILIFDDSLSAVDAETDAQIRQALGERKKGITTFIISQRITTLMGADKILVLEQGRLSDMGTHEELISRGGLYARIWNIQTMLEEDLEEEAGAE